MAERVLERVAEQISRPPAWDGVRRADLAGGPGATDRPRPSPAEEEFSDAWGRAALRDDKADEQAE
jgi:hypothetical protein